MQHSAQEDTGVQTEMSMPDASHPECDGTL